MDEIRLSSQALYGESISPLIYGQFIEFINDLIPSMWADRLQDRSFAGFLQPHWLRRRSEEWSAPRWTAFVCGQPRHATRPESLDALETPAVTAVLNYDGWQPFVGKRSARAEVRGETDKPFLAGIRQDNIPVRKGEELHFQGWVQVSAPCEVRVLLGRDETAFFDPYAALSLQVPPGGWRKIAGTLIPCASDDAASLAIALTQPGDLRLGKVSLMPADAVAGWRADVVEAVRALRPGIIRFGGSSLIFYQWESGVVPREQRAPFENQPWGNMEEHDVGLFEFLQFCELVDAAPMICVNSNSTTLESILSEIEFCNGSADTRWGRVRAELGHAQPFNVRYWQIGNEQEGPEYERVLEEYARAIRAQHPELVLLASYPSQRILTELADSVDYVCPHIYDPYSAAVEQRLTKLIHDIQSGANPALRLAVTEWNHTGGMWHTGARAWLLTQYNALNAARMYHLFQRLGAWVHITMRSNLVNSACSGILQTNAGGMYVTPTYHVTRAYANLLGDRALGVALPSNEGLDVAATRRQSDGEIALAVVNDGAEAQSRRIALADLGLMGKMVSTWTLAAAALETVNSFAEPARVAPVEGAVERLGDTLDYTFAPYSVTILRFR